VDDRSCGPIARERASNQGLATGKAAKGWNVKRPDPTDELEIMRAKWHAIFRDHWAGVLADYQWNLNPHEIPF